MIIRRATNKDFPVLMGLCRNFNTSPYSFDKQFKKLSVNPYPAYAEHMMKGENALTLVAEEEGRVIGFITVAINTSVSAVIGKKAGSILLLAVDDGHRERGIAKRMVQSGLKLLFHSGAFIVTVITDIYNHPAIRVYETFGFRFALAWHIYRYYADEGNAKKAILKNIDTVSIPGLDDFCAFFNRPISLLKERTIDYLRLREHFIKNLKTSIVKGRTSAFEYYIRNKPVGLINIMQDDIARKTIGSEKNIYKVMDLIVPDRENNPEVERKMLQDALSRMDDYCMMEIWIDSLDQDLIHSAEDAGFHLSYTGVAYHLTR